MAYQTLPHQQTQIVLSPTERPTATDQQCVQVLFNSGAQPIPPGSLLSVYTTVPMPGSLVISKNPTVGPVLRVGELVPLPPLPIASLPVTSIDENSEDEDESDETVCSGYDSDSDDLDENSADEDESDETVCSGYESLNDD